MMQSGSGVIVVKDKDEDKDSLPVTLLYSIQHFAKTILKPHHSENIILFIGMAVFPIFSKHPTILKGEILT